MLAGPVRLRAGQPATSSGERTNRTAVGGTLKSYGGIRSRSRRNPVARAHHCEADGLDEDPVACLREKTDLKKRDCSAGARCRLVIACWFAGSSRMAKAHDRRLAVIVDEAGRCGGRSKCTTDRLAETRRGGLVTKRGRSPHRPASSHHRSATIVCRRIRRCLPREPNTRSQSQVLRLTEQSRFSDPFLPQHAADLRRAVSFAMSRSRHRIPPRPIESA